MIDRKLIRHTKYYTLSGYVDKKRVYNIQAMAIYLHCSRCRTYLQKSGAIME